MEITTGTRLYLWLYYLKKYLVVGGSSLNQSGFHLAKHGHHGLHLCRCTVFEKRFQITSVNGGDLGDIRPQETGRKGQTPPSAFVSPRGNRLSYRRREAYPSCEGTQAPAR